MELFHLHTKGIKDNNWVEGKVINVDDKFTNRLGERVNDYNTCVAGAHHPELYNSHKILFESNGIFVGENVELCDLISHYLFLINNGEHIQRNVTIKLLEEASKILHDSRIFKREKAMEEYRQINTPENPSRLHSVFLCNESDLDYWSSNLLDNDLDVFKVEVDNTPFASSEEFFTDVDLSYKETLDSLYSYWHPNLKKVKNYPIEYLATGKILLKEKVSEIKRNNN